MRRLVCTAFVLASLSPVLALDFSADAKYISEVGVSIFKDGSSTYEMAGNQLVQEEIASANFELGLGGAGSLSAAFDLYDGKTFDVAKCLYELNSGSFFLKAGKGRYDWGYGYFFSPAYMPAEAALVGSGSLLEDYDNWDKGSTCALEASLAESAGTFLVGAAVNQGLVTGGDFDWSSQWLRYSREFSPFELQLQSALSYSKDGTWRSISDLLASGNPIENSTISCELDYAVSLSGTAPVFQFSTSLQYDFPNDIDALVEAYKEADAYELGISLNYIPVSNPLEIYNNVRIDLADFGVYVDSRIVFFANSGFKLIFGSRWFAGDKNSNTFANPVLTTVYAGVQCSTKK